MNRILHWDQDIFVYLNSLGMPEFDNFWLFITNQRHWILLYLLIGVLYFYYLGWKKALVSLVIIGIFIGFCDQSTNFFKNYFHRLRPSSEPGLQGSIRDLLHPHNYSFISGHASNATLFVWFSIFLLRKYSKYVYLLIIWWLLFMYSRIYTGVHYPLDILGGLIWGFFLYKIASFVYLKSLKRIGLD